MRAGEATVAIFPHGVARFCAQYGLKPGDLMAVRGPSLGPEKAEFVNFEQEWSAEFRPWFDPSSRTMDLWGLTRAQLLKAGLSARHIYSLDCCTFSLPEQFFPTGGKKNPAVRPA